MLEILVRLQDNPRVSSKNPPKREGDIIVAKLSPAIWGSEEKKHFLLTYLEDAELEARVRATNNNTIIFPYSEAGFKDIRLDDETGKKVIQKKTMTNLCSKRVDIKKDFKNSEVDIKDKGKSLEKIKPDSKDKLTLLDLISDSEEI